ncbi:hypothetical protein PC122_g24437, partial [Phytophthora cactorum]
LKAVRRVVVRVRPVLGAAALRHAMPGPGAPKSRQSRGSQCEFWQNQRSPLDAPSSSKLSQEIPTSNGKQSEYCDKPRVLFPPPPSSVFGSRRRLSILFPRPTSACFVSSAVRACLGLSAFALSICLSKPPPPSPTRIHTHTKHHRHETPFQTGADSTECSLADRFSALDPSAEDCSMDASGSEYSSDENVGYPLEHLDMPHAVPESLRDEAPLDIDQDMEDVMPELTLPTRSQSASRSRSENGDARVSRLHPPMSEIPQHQHDQHHVELNALRCLGLKMMLSNLSTSNNNNNSTNASVASNKPNYSYPGVNDRAKTALLPIRQPSVQSV